MVAKDGEDERERGPAVGHNYQTSLFRLVDNHSASYESTEPELLPPSYQPGSWDVICQGGKESYNHVGNRRFRLCVQNHLEAYMQAKSKRSKGAIVSTIIDIIRSSSTSHGSFVRKDLVSHRWFRVCDVLAREKVGHALRDAIKRKNKKQETLAPSPSTSSDPSKVAPLAPCRGNNPRIGKEAHSRQSPIEANPKASSSSSLTLVPLQFNVAYGDQARSSKRARILQSVSSQASQQLHGMPDYATNDWEKPIDGFADSGVGNELRDDKNGRKERRLASIPVHVPGQPMLLPWKPPGASQMEERNMEFLQNLQPKPFSPSHNGICANASTTCAPPSLSSPSFPTDVSQSVRQMQDSLTLQGVPTAMTWNPGTNDPLAPTPIGTNNISIRNVPMRSQLSSVQNSDSNYPYSTTVERGVVAIGGNFTNAASAVENNLSFFVVDDDIFD